MIQVNKENQEITMSLTELRVLLREGFEQGRCWANNPFWYNDKEEYLKHTFKRLENNSTITQIKD